LLLSCERNDIQAIFNKSLATPNKGSITAESYRKHIVLIIDGWLRLTAIDGHIFMQDNARPYVARDTLDEMAERGIPYIKWPPFSPDSIPSKTDGPKLKDGSKTTILQNYRTISYDKPFGRLGAPSTTSIWVNY
jgi:transposase